MKVTYDPQADAISIYLSNKKSTRTEEIAEDFLVDFHDKIPVGIEILDVSNKLPEDERDKLTLSLIASVRAKSKHLQS